MVYPDMTKNRTDRTIEKHLLCKCRTFTKHKVTLKGMCTIFLSNSL